ncbi:MAG: trigger factor [Lachnospiraceae bacterium]|nr:trigger factor [Lachnospiraceae bacterium]
MKKRLTALIVALMTTAALCGCTDDASKDISKIDVDKYLVSIGDYKNITVEAELQEITDENVETAIYYMLASAPEKVEVTGRTLQNGDVSNIDFEGKVDGVAFNGGTAQGQELEIGSGSFIDGFEDALIGMEIGETRDIDVTFPTDYQVSDLAGKPAVFTVKLNNIYEKQIPDLTEEYVAGLGLEGVTTVDEFKAEVKKQLMETAQDDYNSRLESEAMEQLLNICEFTDEVPPERYNYYYDSMINEAEGYASQYGTDIDTIIKSYYGYENVDDYYSDIKDSAIRATQLDLAMVKILQLEKEKITKKDVDEAVKANYSSFGFNSVEEFLAQIDIDDYKSYLINEKAAQIIVDNVKVVPPTPDVTAE